MKKFLMSAIFIINFSFLSYSQDSTFVASNLPETQTERIIDKYGGKIVESFNALVDKATPLAEEGFKMVVRLQIAKGVGYLIFPLLFCFFYYKFNFCLKRSKWKDKNRKYGDYESEEWNRYATLTIIYFILSITFLIATCITFMDMIQLFIAPEWFAIKEILNLF